MIKKVILTPNPYRDGGFRTVQTAQRILQEAGLETRICLPFEVDKSFVLPREIRFSRLDRELNWADMVICFGGDGIGGSTPTGSTAYSLSAGGPIVEPAARSILLTPICAHDIVSKCIVTSDKRTITVSMAQNARRNAFLSVDGGRAFKMNMGDTATITCSRMETRLVRLKDRSFYDIINNKFKHGV